jgi:hypothetical protein
MFDKKIAWPKYQIIAKRIKVFPINEIKTHPTHNEHKQLIKQSIEKHGFLNPPVIRAFDKWCVSGNHSLTLMSKDYDHCICYEAMNTNEEKFLSRVNKLVWEIIIRGEEVRDFEFIFNDSKLSALIDSCRVLLEP